ncbi:MAG: sulfotransferase [Phycisphaeraceae bacterium]|nr:sulfotransferase [Phycisphaeraceae bacterium]
MEADSAPPTILLLGLPRSGTTWVANVLGLADRMRFVNEPDNEKISWLGRCYKRHVPRFPLLEIGDTPRDFARLWQKAAVGPRAAWLSRSIFARALKAPDSFIAAKEKQPALGFPPSALGPRPSSLPPRLIKSVHAVLCAEWVCSVAPIGYVVVVMRHPMAILASWRRLQMPDATRAFTLSEPVQQRVLGKVIPASDELEKQALHLAVLWRGLEAQVRRNPQWIVIVHEDLCSDPNAKFRQLYEQLGLAFTPRVEAGIAAQNREGSGYKPVRLAGAEVGKWKKDFTDEQRKRATDVLAAAGLAGWL